MRGTGGEGEAAKESWRGSCGLVDAERERVDASIADRRSGTERERAVSLSLSLSFLSFLFGSRRTGRRGPGRTILLDLCARAISRSSRDLPRATNVAPITSCSCTFYSTRYRDRIGVSFLFFSSRSCSIRLLRKNNPRTGRVPTEESLQVRNLS